jgi:photosystem II stability/assembly factor-like uncharacterized protein
VVLADSPDDATTEAWLLAVGAKGNVTTTTMRAFERSEMQTIVDKASSAYGVAAEYLDGGGGGDVIFGNNGGDLMFGRKGGDLMCARDGSGNDLVDGCPSTNRFRADGGDTLISVETPDSCLP